MGEGENNVQMYTVVGGEHVPLGEIGKVELQPVKHRKISRKRFIKLCMAHGWSRNDARISANAIVSCIEIEGRMNATYKSVGSLYRVSNYSYAKVVRQYLWEDRHGV